MNFEDLNFVVYCMRICVYIPHKCKLYCVSELAFVCLTP